MDFEVIVKNVYPYPFERNDQKQSLKAGLHVVIKLAGIEINLRGIFVSVQKGRYWFRLPSRQGSCHKTGAKTEFQIFSFSDPAFNKELLEALHAKTPECIEAFLQAHPQEPGIPHSEPEANVDALKPTTPDQPKDIALEGKRSAISGDQQDQVGKAASVKKPVSIEYMDPPKRKTITKGRAAYAVKQR